MNFWYRVIVAYKTIKAFGELVLAAVLFVVALTRADRLQQVALGWQAAAVHAWSMHLASVLVTAAKVKTLEWLSLAAALDGVLTLFEAWALRRGRPWGAWVVVVATGGLLPFEVHEIVVHRRFARVVLFLVNLAIVVYLARRARRGHS